MFHNARARLSSFTIQQASCSENSAGKRQATRSCVHRLRRIQNRLENGSRVSETGSRRPNRREGIMDSEGQ